MVPSGRVIVTGLAAVIPEGGSSRLLRAVRRLIGTVALQAVIAACRWRRHGLDFTAWLTSEATQDPGNVEICPVRTTDALAPVSGSRQLACGVARARQETNSGHFATLPGPWLMLHGYHSGAIAPLSEMRRNSAEQTQHPDVSGIKIVQHAHELQFSIKLRTGLVDRCR